MDQGGKRGTIRPIWGAFNCRSVHYETVKKLLDVDDIEWREGNVYEFRRHVGKSRYWDDQIYTLLSISKNAQGRDMYIFKHNPSGATETFLKSQLAALVRIRVMS